MKIKICGITNIKDALDACDAGADALGFVFYEKSPRYIAPCDAAKIVQALPPFVQAVGLFVTTDNISSTCAKACIGTVQLHFDNPPNGIDGLQSIKVIRASKKSDVLMFNNQYRLVDSFVESFGGCGKRVAIEWFEGVDTSKIILAGGLTPDNISNLAQYGFYGFDVSSGVESSLGKKDKQKMIDFIAIAKAQKA